MRFTLIALNRKIRRNPVLSGRGLAHLGPPKLMLDRGGRLSYSTFAFLSQS